MSHRGRHQSIDLGLEIIAIVSEPGVRWTLDEIAEICGCGRNAIYQFEKKALTKLQRAARRHEVIQLKKP